MNPNEETHLNPEEARAGRKTRFMPWVLGLSFGAAILLAVLALTGWMA